MSLFVCLGFHMIFICVNYICVCLSLSISQFCIYNNCNKMFPLGQRGGGKGGGVVRFLLVVPTMRLGHRFSSETLTQSHAKPMPAETCHF